MMKVLFMNKYEVNNFYTCDETCTPLLDQGVVEASGSLTLLTFAVEKIRADSFSF